MLFLFLRLLFILILPGLIYGAQPDFQYQSAPHYLLDEGVEFAIGKTAEEVVVPMAAALDKAGVESRVHIDYPFGGSVFPPDIVAPTFLWHDSHADADVWLIEVAFEASAQPIYVLTAAEQPGQRMDPRAVSPTHKTHQRSDYDLNARAWTPASGLWETIKSLSVEHPATISIYGFSSKNLSQALSEGTMSLRTSPDPVAAPIFYRDVPLMPSDTGKSIKPIAEDALDLIAWRLRDISKEEAPAVLQKMPTCANCHSFSKDGAVLGMDMDGPQGDKGAYGLVGVEPHIVIEDEDIITWNSYKGTPKGHMNFGLFSQVSPDGRYVVSTLNEATFVQNYRNFKFLQSFFPTRGILVVYDRETGEMAPLPGATSTDYVHANATWSPDGTYLVFSRAPAKDKDDNTGTAQYSGDSRETQIQYDLYRIPFNEGMGGAAVPLQGASSNGKSNSFPKISPDGKWLVFVQAQNGQLMRPDSKLYIMPAEGGEAREMNCNLNPMNSWHSWSPCGKWMVFSSKGLRPFTQMFLTHIDDQGVDTPAILIPNSTADNRAVNIPEFLNGPGNAIENISAPTQRSYRYYSESRRLMDKEQWTGALMKVNLSLALNPHYANAYLLKSEILIKQRKIGPARETFEKMLEILPNHEDGHYSLGALLGVQNRNKTIEYYRKALLDHPEFMAIRRRLVDLHYTAENYAAMADECMQILKYQPEDIHIGTLLGVAYYRLNKSSQAQQQFKTVLTQAILAAQQSDYKDAEILSLLATAYAASGSFDRAVEYAERAHQIALKDQNRILLSQTSRQIKSLKSGSIYIKPLQTTDFATKIQ